MAPSLARQLMQWLLPTSLALVGIGGVISYQLAHRAATLAYDRALLDAAQSVATQVNRTGDRFELNLSLSTEQVLLFDNQDRVFYEVVNSRGEWVAGSHGLPRPPGAFSEDKFHYYDGEFGGQEVRAATLQSERDGVPFFVTVAETVVKRQSLIREILLAMLLPEMLLMTMTITVIAYATRSGLSGIRAVREELVKRSQANMRPVPLDTVPAELRPLISDTNDLLERLSFSLERHRHLIADASHQLRTPIAALRAEAESALRADDPKAALARIAEKTTQLSRLAHNVLMLNRLESGYMQNPQMVDLGELIRNAAVRWLPFARQRMIDLGFALEPSVTSGEPVWMEELINNLVDNAMRYTAEGGIVTVKCGTRDGAAWLSVEDSGPGIPAQERERIFERFYRVHAEQGEGSGLGLSIVREVANAHRATIDVGDSRELPGAEIRVSFPAPR